MAKPFKDGFSVEPHPTLGKVNDAEEKEWQGARAANWARANKKPGSV